MFCCNIILINPIYTRITLQFEIKYMSFMNYKHDIFHKDFENYIHYIFFNNTLIVMHFLILNEIITRRQDILIRVINDSCVVL